MLVPSQCSKPASQSPSTGVSIGVAMNRVERVARVQAALANTADIVVVVRERIRNEQDARHIAEIGAHCRTQEGDTFRRAEAAAAEQDAYGSIREALSVGA